MTDYFLASPEKGQVIHRYIASRDIQTLAMRHTLS